MLDSGFYIQILTGLGAMTKMEHKIRWKL